MEVKKDCVHCDCNDCLLNGGEYSCPGCLDCTGNESCGAKVTIEDFKNELHIHLKTIREHFESKHGKMSQIRKLLEEGSELLIELSKTDFNFTDLNVLDESADYIIVLLQKFKIQMVFETQEGDREYTRDLTNLPRVILFNNANIKDMQYNAEYVYSALMTEIKNVDMLDSLYIRMFNKVMRTLDRIESKYYEEGVEDDTK